MAGSSIMARPIAIIPNREGGYGSFAQRYAVARTVRTLAIGDRIGDWAAPHFADRRDAAGFAHSGVVGAGGIRPYRRTTRLDGQIGRRWRRCPALRRRIRRWCAPRCRAWRDHRGNSRDRRFDRARGRKREDGAHHRRTGKGQISGKGIDRRRHDHMHFSGTRAAFIDAFGTAMRKEIRDFGKGPRGHTIKPTVIGHRDPPFQAPFCKRSIA